MVTCEVIIHGYEEYGIEIINKLSGIFCSVLYDPETKGYVAARDPVGVNPVYQGWLKDGSVWFASEMKCLVGVCERIVNFHRVIISVAKMVVTPFPTSSPLGSWQKQVQLVR